MSEDMPSGGPPDPIAFLHKLSADEGHLYTGQVAASADDSSSKKRRPQDPPARERPLVSIHA
jgi:hypothetical protein